MTYDDKRSRGQCARAAAKSVGIAGALHSVSAAIMVTPTAASAHATGQSFIALLPTGPYMAIGVAIVALSIMLLWFLPPHSTAAAVAEPRHRPDRGTGCGAHGLQLPVFLLLCGGIGAGFGARDPLENPLVLGFWVTFWMASPMVQGYLFDLWGWISPWRWAARPMTELTTSRLLPCRDAPASGRRRSCSLLCFSAFTLADPAPDDPARLAKVMAGLWLGDLCRHGAVRTAPLAAAGGIPVGPDGAVRQAGPAGAARAAGARGMAGLAAGERRGRGAGNLDLHPCVAWHRIVRRLQRDLCLAWT